MEKRILALAEYLEVNPEDIKEGYADNVFEVDGMEFYVATPEEAYEADKQEIKDLYDDLGINLFSEKFQKWIYENALDEEKIDKIIEEEIEYYTEQEPDDNMVEYLTGLEGADKVNYLKELFDEKGFIEFVRKENLVDLDKVIEECIEMDGVANNLASYDGKEIVLNDEFNAYRIS